METEAMLETCRDGICALPASASVANPLAHPFHVAIREAAVPVLVDCFIEECGPCEALSLVLPKLEAEFAGRLRLMKLDGTREAVLKATYGVEAFPTLLGFHRGEVVQRLEGFQLADYPALRRWIANFLMEATGVATPATSAEPAFEYAVASALAAHDAVTRPLLDAAVLAQEPHLPAHQAAVAHCRMALAAGEIDMVEYDGRLAGLSARLHEAIGEPLRLLHRAEATAGPALEEAIAEATTAFLIAAK